MATTADSPAAGNPPEQSKDGHGHGDTAKPFTYTPTVSEFRQTQQLLRDKADEQSPLFHDKKIIPDLSAFVNKMNEEKRDEYKMADEDKQVSVHRRAPDFSFGPQGMSVQQDFSFTLNRKDGSSDQAIVDSAGRVKRERVQNYNGVTESNFRPDGTLARERHGRDGYSDMILYDADGKTAIKTHIENGGTTVDDVKQKDGSWKRTTVQNDAKGKQEFTETLVTQSDGSKDLDRELANGDHLRFKTDASGAYVFHDQTITQNGVTRHLFSDKDGESKSEIWLNT